MARYGGLGVAGAEECASGDVVVVVVVVAGGWRGKVLLSEEMVWKAERAEMAEKA